jgi:carboxypeptidase C (cathepsin A)
MNFASLTRGAVALAIAMLSTVATAQDRPSRPGGADRPPRPATEQAESKSGLLRLLPSDAVSERTIDVGGRKLTYTATAGTLPLYDGGGEPSASIFYTAYIAKNAPADRPIMFAFNGGPGAASAFLHLGLVGPKIVTFGATGREPANAKLVDNPDTWLDFTDLVLVDPVGTGWSRPAKSDGGAAFWSVRGDAESLAKFVALYTAKNGRTASPKYLLGESYGGFRAAKVARALQRDQSLFVNGIVMVSPFIEGAFQYGGDRFALGAALQLPSLIATELERQNKFTPEALAAGERFALGEYLTKLAGPPLTGEAASAFYGRVAGMTGLPIDVVTRARGFVQDAYIKNLRKGDGKIVSRYDATFAIDDPFPEREGAQGADPVLDGIVRAYGSAFVGYARDELGFKTDITYQLLARDVTGKWEWGESRNPPSATEDMRTLLTLDPTFRLLIAHGVSDLVTPHAVTRYILDHLPPLSGPSRATLKLHRGGHMFYTEPTSRRDFTTEVKALVQNH